VAATDSGDGNETDRVEFGPAIQNEVRRLPERYRAVVVLCYWQGLSQEQAAARLGCPLGTVRSRLARARTLLHRRLTRQGLVPLAGIIAVALDRTALGAVARLPAVPLQLVQSTVHAACPAMAAQAATQVVSVGVASLVQRVLWSMAMTKINSLVAGLVFVGLIGCGVGFTVMKSTEARQIQAASVTSAAQAVSKDQGDGRKQKIGNQTQPSGSDRKQMSFETVRSNVAGTILSFRPNDSDVKKGEVVCELDSAALRDQLINQRITALSAKANFENARVTRETAEIAVVEYEEGLYRFQLDEVNGDIRIAKAELDLAEDELKQTKELVTKGLAGEYKSKRTELGVLRAEIALNKALSRQKILRDITGPRKTKKLKSSVATARSNELAKNATWELETEKEKRLERQIAACVIKAPLDGRLFYIGSLMVEGKAVGERQALFTITPASAPNPK
jgi:hypothetical protein